MYKTDVKYEDFNGNKKEETLYFNINKPQLIKLLKERPTFQDDLENLSKRMSKKDPDESVYIDFVSFLDDLVILSYGKKTEDGNFRKSSEITEDFMSSNAYEALYTKFFDDPKEYDAFLNGIFPSDVMEKAIQMVQLPEETNTEN